MTPVIEIDNLTRTFGAVTAVDRLNITVNAGEVFGLVGPDGAGKTTTLRILCGLMGLTSGSVRVAGLDVTRNSDEVKDRIGYMAQRFGLYPDLTVEENMIFYADLFAILGKQRDDLMTELLRMTRMEPFRARPAGKLSGGMKQKLALMCTLLHRPQILILDEPTNGVDPVSRRDFWTILYKLVKEGLTVLVTTAYLDEAERCDRVGLMDKGRLILMDTPAALKDALPQPCYEVVSADLRAARKALRNHPGVADVELAGSKLHVFLNPGAAEETLHQVLPEAGIRRIPPSLEDVFIMTVRAQGRAA
ncbi:MAG TPA: ABC transporter ATP-binding protein [Bryobacteraceae bacterium]|nr:ABC transporter ATP-binding protein [Bryobacteraceae bacterium]